MYGEDIIRVSGLKKSYAGRQALAGVGLTVKRGGTVALLGPNGAGKSTAISILSTLLAPDAGTAEIDGLALGRDDREIRRRIGVVFQHGVLDELLTVEENLSFRGRFYGFGGSELQARVRKTAVMTGVRDILDRRYGELSGGQKRRCDIARALLQQPSILIMDEPGAGLDPEIRRSVRATIGEIKKKTGMTVLLATHYMEEASDADRVVVLKNGAVAAAGSPRELRERYASDVLLLWTERPDALRARLGRGGIKYECGENSARVRLRGTGSALPVLELCRGLYSAFEVKAGDLDDAYISIMQRDAANA